MFRNMSFDKRQITDPRIMRALAHPTRIDLLELVAREGELTATAAADALGLSPANCSFHLRQLGKYGFLEEAEPGPGRTRPWRIGSVHHSWEEVGANAEATAAASALTSVVLERDLNRLRDWLARQPTAEPRWRKAAFLSEALLYLTPDELHSLGEGIVELVKPYIERVAPDRRPTGSAPVQLLAVGFPIRPTAAGN
jgi:DNA-binding transcriptional ArsR family regulator